MALNLMGGACINEDVLASSRTFSGKVGYSVYNIAVMNTVILRKNTDDSYLVHIDVMGSQLGGQGAAGSFKWLSIEPIVAEAKKLTEKIYYKCLFSEIPFYNQSIMGDIGYCPVVHYDPSNGVFEAGRIYDQNGSYGGWPMSSLRNGSYAFGFYVKLW